MSVQMRVHVLRTFITHPLVHIHQKEKIALEIAAKVASVNGPLHCTELTHAYVGFQTIVSEKSKFCLTYFRRNSQLFGVFDTFPRLVVHTRRSTKSKLQVIISWRF
jgi:hypothetical protein